MARVLALPDSQNPILTIRAKALVFNGPASQALLAQVDKIAATDAAVLILGETGSGKELPKPFHKDISQTSLDCTGGAPRRNTYPKFRVYFSSM
jgi:transcriptional regulator with GAF, ATPase, and Fis domain